MTKTYSVTCLQCGEEVGYTESPDSNSHFVDRCEMEKKKMDCDNIIT